jgi:cytoskeletal protein CcmA (bactofilin family)
MSQEKYPSGATMQNQRIADTIADDRQRSSVSKTTTITGEISGQGDLRLDGRFDGDLKLQGILFIGAECSFQGKAEAENIIIEGRVEGRIKALDKIEIRAGGQVRGKIVCQQIAIAEGAFLDGNVESGKGKLVAPTYFSEKRKELQNAGK